MVPRITIADPLHSGIVVRALVDHARQLINLAADPTQEIVKRQKLIHTARIALSLAEDILQGVPNMPLEYPDEFDAELLAWLNNMV